MVISKDRIDMSDMIVCDEGIRLYLSKPQRKNADLIPEMGQEVVLTQSVATGDTQIEVEPLQENIKQGTILNFVNNTGTAIGSVTVAIPPKNGDRSIAINAASVDIAVYSIAVTDGIEQVLTLANDVAPQDRVITLASPIIDWLEAGRSLSFDNGVDLIVKYRAELGATTVLVEPAKFAIPAGESVALANYLEAYSINQLDDSSSANTLNERNYKSGKGTGKAVTSYNDTITIGGNYVKGDFALNRLYSVKTDPLLRGYINYATIVEPEGGEDRFAKVHLGQSGNQRPNDQTKKISATLEVDGMIENRQIPRMLID